MAKSKKNKKLSTLLVVTLLAAIAVGGMLAYLQDEAYDENVMTLGSVSIEQHEYERIVGEDGEYTIAEYDGVKSYVLKDFTQGKPLMPAVIPNGGSFNGVTWNYDSIPVRMTQVDSYGSASVFNTPNAQDKFVTVENTGKSDAFVRTLIAFECGSVVDYEEFWSLINAEIRANEDKDGKKPWDFSDAGIITVDGSNYRLVELVYQGAKLSDGSWRHENGILPAGDTTYPSLCQVYMAAEATNEDVVALDGNRNGTYDILVLSQAIQSTGFASNVTSCAEDSNEAVSAAANALNAGFGVVSTETKEQKELVTKWFIGFTDPEMVAANFANDADALVEALETSKDVILTEDVNINPAGMSNAYGKTGINVKNGQTIDGGGNVLDIKGAGGTWDSGINTTGGLIKNITVTGSFRGIFINHNSTHSERVVLDNVIIDGTVYTISCDQGSNQGLTATNSVFNGWTSYAATLGDAKFVNCSFGEGSGYAFCRPYAPTEFIGCEFEAGFLMDPRAAVTLENCTLDGEIITSENVGELVYQNLDKVTVK